VEVVKLEDKSDIELKAMIYDQICTVELIQQNIAVIKQELAKRIKATPDALQPS